MSEMGSDTVAKAKQYATDINNARKNIAKAFTLKSTINNHLVDIQNSLDEQMKSFKTVQDNQARLTSLAEKPKTEVAGGEAKVQANAAEKAKVQSDLLQAKNKLGEVKQEYTQKVNTFGDSMKAEMNTQHDFKSETDVGTAVSKLFKTAFDKESGVYDENLGNTKIETGNIVDSLEKYKDELFKGSKTKSADVAQNQIDQLKLRQIVGDGGSESDIYKKLQNSGVNPKLYEKMNLDQLKQRYPALTSDYLKTAKNSIYNSIEKGADESSLREYNNTVKPSFDNAFDSAVKDKYGQGRLDKIKQADANWNELRKNPLSSIENPSLNVIDKNWQSFVSTASKIDGGQELIHKIQNYVGSDILNNAKTNTGYSATTILNGIRDYGSMLDEQTKNKLEGVLNTVNDKTAIDNQVKNISDIKTQEKTITQEGGVLKDKLNQVKQTAKAIGSDSSDIEQKIMKLNSMEKLNKFVADSGETMKEITPAIMQALMEQADKESGKPSDANYDLKVIDNFIKKVNDLGGKESQGQTVNNALLGGEDSQTFKDFQKLEKLNENYKKLSDATKTKMGTTGRIFKGLFGAFLAVGGLGFGRFKGISDLRSALNWKEAPDEVSGRARIEKIEPFDKGKIVKAAKVGAITNVGKDNQNQ